MNPLHPRSTRESAVIVIAFLGIHSMTSLIGTIALVVIRADPATIAIVAGMGGASTGALTAMLSQTEKQHPMPSGTPDDPINTKVGNTEKDPVPTTTTE
jgi:hypothetical protein